MLSRVACLILTLTAAVFVARALGLGSGRTLPALLTGPDGAACAQPCLFGVQPGSSTMDEALAALRTHPYTRAYQQRQRTNFNGATGQIGLQFVGPGPTIYLAGNLGARVTSISAWYTGRPLISADTAAPERPQFGAIIDNLGVPPRLIIDGERGNLKSLYFDDRMFVEIGLSGHAQSVDVSAPLNGVGLGLSIGYLRYTQGGSAVTWQGFAALWRYTKQTAE